MEAKTKLIESNRLTTKSFSLLKKIAKRVHDEVVSPRNTYIITYIYISANPVRRPCNNAVLYSTANSHGEKF